MRTRAFRRHQRERVRASVVRLIRDNWYHSELADCPRYVGKMTTTRHPCSCMGCGHQRFWWGPTLQERKAS